LWLRIWNWNWGFEFWVLDEIDIIEKKEKTLGEKEIICLLYKRGLKFLVLVCYKKGGWALG
jgi:hypothetical protein